MLNDLYSNKARLLWSSKANNFLSTLFIMHDSVKLAKILK